MKKLMACILVVGMMAGIAGAQEVLSRNAVGYVKVEVPAGGLDILATPFVNFDGGDQTINDVFGTDVPNGSIIFVWDAVAGSYEQFSFLAGEWYDGAFQPGGGDTELPRGQGVWFRNPDTEPVHLYFMGEVPGEVLDETPVNIYEGLTMLSFAYPVFIGLDDPDATLTPDSGDIVFVWDAEAGSYEQFSYLAGTWYDGSFTPGVAPVLEPGRGFWYRTSTGKAWTQERPYTWP